MSQAYPACRTCKDFDSSKCATTCMWRVEYQHFKKHGNWEPEPFEHTHTDSVKVADRVIEDAMRSLRF